MADKNQKLYFQGKPVEDGYIENHEHISPVSMYVKILGALFVLTGLTYAVSYMNLGAASLTVAMIVAAFKATLVCAYFMHLKYDDRFNVFVFVSTLLFVAIFFTFTLFDMASRNRLSDEQGTFERRNERMWVDGYEGPNPLLHPPACTDRSILVCEETFEPCGEGLVRRIEDGCFKECVDPNNECKPAGAPKAKPEDGKADAKADGKADAKAAKPADAKAAKKPADGKAKPH